jgi:hypothetical protein
MIFAWNSLLSFQRTAVNYITCFTIQNLCVVPKRCMCVFRMILGTENEYFPNINRLVFVMETQSAFCEVENEF